MSRHKLAHRPLMSCLKPFQWPLLSLPLSAIAWLLMLTPSRAACDWLEIPQRFNTRTMGDTVVIGLLPARPYRVILPDDSLTTLAALRPCLLDAFITRSEQSGYIQAGSFEESSEAENLQRALQQAGYRSRLIYRY